MDLLFLFVLVRFLQASVQLVHIYLIQTLLLRDYKKTTFIHKTQFPTDLYSCTTVLRSSPQKASLTVSEVVLHQASVTFIITLPLLTLLLWSPASRTLIHSAENKTLYIQRKFRELCIAESWVNFTVLDVICLQCFSFEVVCVTVFTKQLTASTRLQNLENEVC